MSNVRTPVAPREAAPDGNDVLHEVINGKREELPPMGVYESGIASILNCYLGPYARAHQLGRVVVQGLFRLVPLEGIERRPDVAFASFGRWPKKRPLPATDAWDVLPNLAVEVIS